jgi:hypothetical protein
MRRAGTALRIPAQFLCLSLSSGLKADYPIAAADPPSWEGHRLCYYCPAQDGFRFKIWQRTDAQRFRAVRSLRQPSAYQLLHAQGLPW